MADPDGKAAPEHDKPLASKARLTPVLLEEIGIGPTKIETVCANLLLNGRETVGNLLDLKTEAKAIEFAGDDAASGERLWGFITEQRALRTAPEREKPLAPKSRLTPVLLEEIGVGPTKIETVCASLLRNGRETVGNLLDLKTEAKAVECAGDDASGQRLWSFIKEQRALRHPRAEVGGVPFMATSIVPEKAFTEAREGDHDIASFILRQLIDELQNAGADGAGPLHKRLKVNAEERFIELADGLEGLHGGRKRLFVRDAMISVVEKIMSYLAADFPPKWLLLGGTRGCGKSVVGSLVVILLAVKGQVVLYQQRGTLMLILSEKVAREDKAALDEVMTRARVPTIPLSNSVWIVDPLNSVFQHFFFTVPTFIFVQDLGDDVVTIPPQNGNGKRLIISSPNADKLSIVRKKNLVRLIIMPTWRLDEIKQVEARDEESVENRFERVGGIPRWVVDQEKGVTEAIQDKQIANLPLTSLNLVFGEDGYLNLPSQVDKSDSKKSTDLIFRIEPINGSRDGQSEDDDDCQIVLSSPYVTEKLAERFLRGTEDEVLQFAHVIQKSDRLSELRGRTLEGAVHRALKQGNSNSVFKTMSVLRLETEREPVPVLTDVPTMEFASVREFVDIADIPKEHLVHGAYFHAKRKNEATIDAFALVDEAFVQKHFPGHPVLKVGFGRAFKGEKFFVLFIQVTIAREHVVDGTILHQRQKELQEKLGLSKLPIVYCFISWPSGITRHQEVTRYDPKKKERVAFQNQREFGPQHVVRLRGKFDEIAALIA